MLPWRLRPAFFRSFLGFPSVFLLPSLAPVSPVGAELMCQLHGCVIPGICTRARAFPWQEFGSGKVYPGNDSEPGPGRCGAAPGARDPAAQSTDTLCSRRSESFPMFLSRPHGIPTYSSGVCPGPRPRSAGKGLAQLVCRWSSRGSLLSELVPYQPGSGIGMGLGWAPGLGWGWDGLCGSRLFSRGHSCTWS